MIRLGTTGEHFTIAKPVPQMVNGKMRPAEFVLHLDADEVEELIRFLGASWAEVKDKMRRETAAKVRAEADRLRAEAARLLAQAERIEGKG